MIEELIKQGEKLGSEVEESMGRKFIRTVNFEAWASKSVMYLETNHASSVVTEKAKERFKAVTSNNSFSFYQFLLGALKAVQEYEENNTESEEDYL